jgi:hypothetical protein
LAGDLCQSRKREAGQCSRRNAGSS